MATKVKRLIDCRVVVEPSSFYHDPRTIEEQAKALDRWARELKEFFRDHRSQDVNNVTVEREYEDQCSSCQRKWEVDTDCDTGQLVCAWCGEPIETGEPAEATER